MNFNFFKLLRIKGWINITNIKVFYLISIFFGKKKSILEIGTHYGKSLIPLIIKDNFSKVLVVDVFDKQNLNISQSGKGCLFYLKKNLNKFNINLKKINFINDCSENLNKNIYKSILKKFNKFDVIHIDGGHNYNEVVNDIKFSLNHSKKKSVIIIDDIFHPSYPDVLRAFLKFKIFFYQVFLTDQKIFLSRSRFTCNKLRNYIFNNADFNIKEINFFGYKTFYISENHDILNSFIINKINLIKSLLFFKYRF
jgi:hypothetical protein